jgi:hypothetical protein
MDEEQGVSQLIDGVISQSVQSFHEADYQELNEFEELLSLGELTDRLTIVNIKLFKLKDDVMSSDDAEFKSWAAEQDVYLVMERARLKRCIDTKLKTEIDRIVRTGESGYNPEVKKYGV